jgi:hypothetical protein
MIACNFKQKGFYVTSAAAGDVYQLALNPGMIVRRLYALWRHNGAPATNPAGTLRLMNGDVEVLTFPLVSITANNNADAPGIVTPFAVHGFTQCPDSCVALVSNTGALSALRIMPPFSVNAVGSMLELRNESAQAIAFDIYLAAYQEGSVTPQPL